MNRFPQRVLTVLVAAALTAGVVPAAAQYLGDGDGTRIVSRHAQAGPDAPEATTAGGKGSKGSKGAGEDDEASAGEAKADEEKKPNKPKKPKKGEGGEDPGGEDPPGEPTTTPTDYIALAPTLSQPDHPETVREVVDVEMADGTHLYTEVVRPDPSLHGDGPWPVILEASPYHGTLADRDGTRMFPDPTDDEGNLLGLTGYFAPRGYAVVMVDLRGTGRSSGCLDQLGPNDASDLKEIVEWAASQDWSNGRVGMTGHSYVGSTPSVAAAMAPEGLVTIVPSAGLASMYDHQFNKGVPWNLQWAGPQYAYQALAINRHLPPGLPEVLSPTGDNFGEDMESFGCGLQSSATLSGPGQVTGQYSDWHAARDWSEGAAAADIPVFMIHGIHDNAARIPAAEWFFANRFGRPGDKVWIGQWDHGSTNGRCGNEDGERVAHPTCRFDQMQYAMHAWFDKHLAQRDVDTGPAVEAFLNGERPVNVSTVVDPETLSAKAFAQPAWTEPTTWHSLFPDATDMSLGTEAPEQEGTGTFGVLADALLQGVGATDLTFTSEPLADDTVFLGLPQMRLDVSMSYGQVADVVTTLFREDANGNRQAVSFCAIQPQLRDGVETLSPVVPGEVMALDLQCFTTAQWIPAGQKLVLQVGTRSPHHASLGSDAQMTLHTGPESSAYHLPTAEDVDLVDDVPLREGGDSGDPVAVGPAQPAIHDSVVLPLADAGLLVEPGVTAAVYEFASEEGYDNASMHAVVTDIEGDVDLWLDRLNEAGEWEEVTSGANGFDIGGPETLDTGRLAPGAYRLRIGNFASVPGEIQVDITFANSAGEAGPDGT
jgi:uncharacterized protein